MFTFKIQSDDCTRVIQGDAYKYFDSENECIDLQIFNGHDLTEVLTLRFCQPSNEPLTSDTPIYNYPYGVFVMNDQGRTVDRVGWPGRALPPSEFLSVQGVQSVG